MSVKKLLRKKQQKTKKEEKSLDELFLRELEKEKIDCCGEDRYGI